MVWMFSASVVHVQPCGGLRKLYSRVTAVVNHAYYENRDTSGHLGLELVGYSLSIHYTVLRFLPITQSVIPIRASSQSIQLLIGQLPR